MHTLHRVAMLAASTTLFALSTVSPMTASEHCAVTAPPALVGDATPASPVAHHAEVTPEQLYVDMMIPHHVSIVALAETALPSLREDRLREMAVSIAATQEAEIAQLHEMRAARFGSPDPTPMDDDMLAALHTIMPEGAANGHASDEMQPEMAMQMNSAALIDAFCLADDPDLAFAELTLAHHQMAVDSSRGLLATTQDAELRDLAERVIEAQEAEITILRQVLDERAVASPTP